LDKLSAIGAILGLLAVFGGAIMEGIPLSSVLIPTAAIIVFGGTAGAILLQSSSEEIRDAKVLVRKVFKEEAADPRGVMSTILELSRVARRDGMLALEGRLKDIDNKFLVTALGLLIDGVAAEELRNRLEIATSKIEEKYQNAARVFEAGGGFAPTVGILGAVLGLIHVMQSLDDPSKLGSGIAVAFVATIYGVAAANLFLLPMAGKLKARMRAEAAMCQLITEGVHGMADGQPTSALEQTMALMLGEEEEEPAGEKAEEGAAAPQAA
jgi:chemotaxis protein MotA